MNTVRIGFVGEQRVKIDLIERLGFHVYAPVIDDHMTDLLVDTGKNIKKVQVKTTTKLKTKTSIEIPLKKYVNSDVNIIAVYFMPKDLICYYPYNGEDCINLAVTTAVNNQDKGRNWFYKYMDFPL